MPAPKSSTKKLAKKKLAKKKPASAVAGTVTEILQSLVPHSAEGVFCTTKQVRAMHVISPRHGISIATRKTDTGKGYLVWRLK